MVEAAGYAVAGIRVCDRPVTHPVFDVVSAELMNLAGLGVAETRVTIYPFKTDYVLKQWLIDQATLTIKAMGIVEINRGSADTCEVFHWV